MAAGLGADAAAVLTEVAEVVLVGTFLAEVETDGDAGEATEGADGVRLRELESFFFLFTEFCFLAIICALMAAFFLFSGLRGSLGLREV